MVKEDIYMFSGHYRREEEIIQALKIKKGLEKSREAIQKEIEYFEGKQSHVHQAMFLKIIDEIIEESKYG